MHPISQKGATTKRFSVGPPSPWLLALSARIEDIISDKSHGTKERSESDGHGGKELIRLLGSMGPFLQRVASSCENQFSKVNF